MMNTSMTQRHAELTVVEAMRRTLRVLRGVWVQSFTDRWSDEVEVRRGKSSRFEIICDAWTRR